MCFIEAMNVIVCLYLISQAKGSFTPIEREREYERDFFFDPFPVHSQSLNTTQCVSIPLVMTERYRIQHPRELERVRVGCDYVKR